MATKHIKLEAVKELRFDGHCHVFSNPRPRANKWWRDPGSRKLVDLVGYVQRAGINAVALTNAGNDWLYERFTSQVRELPAGYGFYQDERVTQVLDSEGRAYTFIKGEELFTREGHLLVWGTNFGQMYQPIQGELRLDEALDEIEKDSLLTIISDHTWYNGFFGRGLGASGALDDEKIRKRIHAYEVSSLVPRKANERTLEMAKMDGKPVVCNSDAHRPNHIGFGYNIFKGDDLGWDRGEDFVVSLNENVTNNNLTAEIKKMRQIPLGGICHNRGKLHHAYMIILDHKIGLIKKDAETDDFDIKQARGEFSA